MFAQLNSTLPRGYSFVHLPLLVLAICAVQLSTARAADTAFGYQGRLSENDGLANGLYDFTFQAFDAPVAGNSIGGAVNVNGVGVTNGLFTALLDLGSAPFTGRARWLQISVSPSGADNFTTLTPRQALTPSPYAIYANIAGTVTNGAIANAQLAANAVADANIQNSSITSGKIASGQVVKSLNDLTDTVSLTQGANVSINTVGNSLQISGPAPGLHLPYAGSGSNSESLFTFTNSGTGPAGVFLGEVGVGTSDPAFPLDVAGAVRITSTGHGAEVLNLGTERNWAFRQLNSGAGTALELASIGGGGNKNFVVNIPGFVGIGTNTPISKLDVRGDIHLGESGEFTAVGGEENLRIIRGMVYFPQFSQPIIAGGSGFTVIRPTSERAYLITFTTPFSGQPAVTVTVNEGETVQKIFGVTRNVTQNRLELFLRVSVILILKGPTELSNLLRSVHAEVTHVHPLNLSKHRPIKTGNQSPKSLETQTLHDNSHHQLFAVGRVQSWLRGSTQRPEYRLHLSRPAQLGRQRGQWGV